MEATAFLRLCRFTDRAPDFAVARDLGLDESFVLVLALAFLLFFFAEDFAAAGSFVFAATFLACCRVGWDLAVFAGRALCVVATVPALPFFAEAEDPDFADAWGKRQKMISSSSARIARMFHLLFPISPPFLLRSNN
jgi:hypothetical protein